jgi:hypothetical protein
MDDTERDLRRLIAKLRAARTGLKSLLERVRAERLALQHETERAINRLLTDGCVRAMNGRHT